MLVGDISCRIFISVFQWKFYRSGVMVFCLSDDLPPKAEFPRQNIFSLERFTVRFRFRIMIREKVRCG